MKPPGGLIGIIPKTIGIRILVKERKKKKKKARNPEACFGTKALVNEL